MLPQQLLANDAARGGRILAITLLVSTIGISWLFWLNPELSGDVATATVMVPLLISYVMIRLVMWIASGASEPTEEQLRAIEKDHNSPMNLVQILTVAFGVGMWILFTAAFSAAVYWSLGMAWSLDLAVRIIRSIVYLVGGAAVFLCVRWLCRTVILQIDGLVHAFLTQPIRFPLSRHFQ